MTTIYIKAGTKLPKRHENDLYVTEIPLIQEALRWGAPLEAQTVLDIGAGDGRWGRLAGKFTEAKNVVGVELENQPLPLGFTDWYPRTDYMAWKPPFTFFDLIVSNPPYALAEQIIWKAWGELAPGGTMLMLLRLAFQEGVDRYHKMWGELYPWKVGVLSRRPRFYGTGTNGTAFGLFQWVKRPDGRPYGKPRQWTVELVIYNREKRPRKLKQPDNHATNNSNSPG